MFGVGKALGDAIVKQNPDMFAGSDMPSAMPNTGMGGAAQDTNAPIMAWTAGITALLAAGVFLIPKKVSNQQ